MINELLSKLGANTKITVGISISPSVGLEMIEIDKNTKSISKYGCRPLPYNYSSREIENYHQFKDLLLELFDELKISKKSNVVLNLPTVMFGIISISNILQDNAITNAIISESEKSYIFKRQDPIVDWMKIESKNETKDSKDILYSAIQQSALDEIKQALTDIGCTLVAVEISPLSILKTLDYNNLATEQMQPEKRWTLIIINQNSYSIYFMDNKNIVEYHEEPLALKSFDGDEIYNAIITSSMLTLENRPMDDLYLISETDLISAEVLAIKLQYNGQVRFLESNKYVQNNLMKTSLNILPNIALKITPEAIGAGLYQLTDYPLHMNLVEQGGGNVPQSEVEEIPRLNIGNMEIELTSVFIKKFSMLLAVILLIPAVLLYGALTVLSGKQEEELNKINTEISNVKAELQKYNNEDTNQFNSVKEIEKITQINKKKILYYSGVGINIPKKVWLTSLRLSVGGGVDIKGRSNNVESIYTFYKNLKSSIIDSDLRMSKLEMITSSIENVINNEPKYYEFEITNISDAELQQNKNDKDEQQDDKQQDGKSADTVKKTNQEQNDKSVVEQPKSPENSESKKNPPKKGLPENLEKIEHF